LSERCGRAAILGAWRALHAFSAALVIVLGVGHAVLTDGALDGAGTPLLLGLATLGLAALIAARARPAPARR